MSTPTPPAAPESRPDAHAEARRRYWAANQDETGDPDEYGTVAFCVETVAAGKTVGPEPGCPLSARCPWCNEPTDAVQGACPECGGDLAERPVRCALCQDKMRAADAVEIHGRPWCTFCADDFR